MCLPLPRARRRFELKKLNVAEARGSFAGLINEAGYAGQIAVITRRGKEIAAIVPMKDLETLRPRTIPPTIMGVQQQSDVYVFTATEVGNGEILVYGGEGT